MKRVPITDERKVLSKYNKSRQNWEIRFNDDQFQPICPECNEPGKIINLFISRDQEKFKIHYGCKRCKIRGRKESIREPDTDLSGVKNLSGELNIRNAETSDKVRKNLELEQWHKLGNEIKDLSRQFRDLWGKYDYHNKTLKELDKLIDQFLEARSEMEKRFYKEYPDQADTQTFYGSNRKQVGDN